MQVKTQKLYQLVLTKIYCSLDDANFTYQFVREFIKNFNGNGEKFYPLFYDCVSGDDKVFKKLNGKCSVIVGFDLQSWTKLFPPFPLPPSPLAMQLMLFLHTLMTPFFHLKMHLQAHISSTRKNVTL